MKKTLIFILGAVLLSGCAVIGWRNPSHGPMMGGGWQSASRYATNGEQIYFTTINENGSQIPYRGGSSFGGMMGGGSLACASCHGPDARGGVHTMHMDVMDAPDIRYSALSSDAVSGEHRDDDHTDEHNEYDLAAFRLAVVEGKHPDGDDLSREMPLWQIDDEDLADLFEYLKSLP
jgi:hypothetical protein